MSHCNHIESLEVFVRDAAGRRLLITSWIPPIHNAVICIIHGLGEYAGRYNEWALQFAEAGYASFSIDLPGHGKSEGKRGYIHSFSCFTDSVEILSDHVKEKIPASNRILYGHSMGGLVALDYLTSRKHSFSSAVITSPWIRLVKGPDSFSIQMARLMSIIAPGITISNRINPDHISTSPEEADRYRNDPGIHDRIAFRTLISVLDAAKKMESGKLTTGINMLLLHGTADRITSYESSVRFCQGNQPFATFIPMQGMYHELHHEPSVKETLFKTIINWLQAQ
jgi:alpha-beta hydrolase superfamily lysophospholipase